MKIRMSRFGSFLEKARETKVLFPYPTLVDVPIGRKIAILSPHPDDDILGCGGVLAKHAKTGASIVSIYMTDGRKGDPTFSSENELVAERRREARAACDIIGIEKVEFSRDRDQELRATTANVGRLGQILSDFKPDLIYAPSFLDNHIDHLETNRIFAKASKAVDPRCKVAVYETWTPLTSPNTIVDITNVIGLKEKAIRCHKTQMKVIDFMTAFKGLNAYRAAFARIEGYAEAFAHVSVGKYAALVREFEKGSWGHIFDLG